MSHCFDYFKSEYLQIRYLGSLIKELLFKNTSLSLLKIQIFCPIDFVIYFLNLSRTSNT